MSDGCIMTAVHVNSLVTWFLFRLLCANRQGTATDSLAQAWVRTVQTMTSSQISTAPILKHNKLLTMAIITTPMPTILMTIVEEFYIFGQSTRLIACSKV